MSFIEIKPVSYYMEHPDEWFVLLENNIIVSEHLTCYETLDDDLDFENLCNFIL